MITFNEFAFSVQKSEIMIFLLIILGVFVGFASGFFGIGGGTVLVPILLLIGVDIKTAIGASVVQMVFSSIFGSFVNYKNSSLKINDGIFVGLGGAFGALFSGKIVALFPDIILLYIFLIALILSIYKFFNSPIQTDKKSIESKTSLFIIGFFLGAIAISVGVGGAVFLTPILVGFLHYDMKRAISMGLFFVVFSSIAGFVSLAIHGFINYKLGLILGVSSLLGVYFGAKSSFVISRKWQKRALLTLYILMFLLTLYKIIGEI